MISRFALLSNFLLASTVLALLSSQLGDRLTRSDENPQSRALSSVESRRPDATSDRWAGAVVTHNGAFNYATATFTVPTPSGSVGSGFSIWVGINGIGTCLDVFLAGIDVKITGTGVSCNAWCQSNTSSPINNFPGFTINPGDVIMTSITMTSMLSAVVIIDNQTTLRNIRQELDVGSSAVDPLSCWNNAEWSIGHFEHGDNLPLVNFSSVTFTYATAASSSGIDYNPLNATIFQLVGPYRQPRTSVTPGNDSIVVTYLR